MPRSDALLQSALDNLMFWCTTFVIAHRLATVQRANRIVVLDRGRIVEQGSHLDLLRRHGLYRELFDLQFGPTAEPGADPDRVRWHAGGVRWGWALYVIARTPTNRSGFSAIDQTWSDPAAYVRRLDDTGAHQFWRMVKGHALALLDIYEGAELLDVGCGTGDDARSLACLVGATGRVVGIDAGATMIAEARKRAEGLHLPLAFYHGDAYHLDFPDYL